MHTVARRRARAAARRRQLRPNYPLSSPPRALQAEVAEPPSSLIDSWKGLFAAVRMLFRGRTPVTRIAVSPVSAEWLKTHGVSTPKHNHIE